MRGRLMSLTTGAIIGVAAGALLVPQLDRNTRRRLKRTGRIVKSTAEDVYDSMRQWNR